MSTIRAERLVAADPTSVALLLAGRTAVDLCPGVTRLADGAGALTVEAAIPSLRASTALLSVRARPPRRLPTSYVTSFSVCGDGLPETEGTVTLTRSGHGTEAVLSLAWEGTDRRVTAAFYGIAHGFLANLAAAAEERSYAA